MACAGASSRARMRETNPALFFRMWVDTAYPERHGKPRETRQTRRDTANPERHGKPRETRQTNVQPQPAFSGGRVTKNACDSSGGARRDEKKNLRGPPGPADLFFFRRDSRSPRGLTRFLSHGPPRTLVGAEAWVCRVFPCLPCLSLFGPEFGSAPQPAYPTDVRQAFILTRVHTRTGLPGDARLPPQLSSRLQRQLEPSRARPASRPIEQPIRGIACERTSST